MKRVSSPLAVAFLFSPLVLLTFFVAHLMGKPLLMMFRDAPTFGAARSVALYAGVLAAACVFVAGAFVAVTVALRPGGWARKALYVLPAWVLGYMFVGFLLAVFRIGRVGRLPLDLGIGKIDLVMTWLTLGAVAGTIAVVTAVARVDLDAKVRNRALKTVGLAAVPTGIAWLGLLATIVIAATTQPSLGGPGVTAGPGQAAMPGAPVAAGPGQAAMPGAPVVPGTPAPGGTTGQPGAQGAPGGTTGQPGVQGAPGARPPAEGGGGGRIDPAAVARRLLLVWAVMTVFGAVALTAIARGWKARKVTIAAEGESVPAARLSRQPEAVRAVASALAVTLVVLAVAQLATVSHASAPTTTPVQWDSVATQELWKRTCGDCHSNDTTWPWYANVAPTSWLTALDVHSARKALNITNLDAMPANRRDQVPDRIARAIKAGSMPPREYLYMHPTARMTDAEKLQLTEGMKRSLP